MYVTTCVYCLLTLYVSIIRTLAVERTTSTHIEGTRYRRKAYGTVRHLPHNKEQNVICRHRKTTAKRHASSSQRTLQKTT